MKFVFPDVTNPLSYLKTNNHNSNVAQPNQNSMDKYAALKMLDDEFKEAKQQEETVRNHVEETTRE